MNKGYIAVFDSGVGGLSLLKLLDKKPLGLNLVYFGDNDNAPYGEKSDRELFRLCVENFNQLKGLNVIALVLACNTLSVSVRRALEEYLRIPVFGVFPPVEINLIKGRSVALLCTPVTAKKYKNTLATVIACKNLAMSVENNLYSLDSIDLTEHIGLNKVHFDCVILGCTHYELIKNKIFNHFCPQIITSGSEFTAKKVLEFIQKQKTLVKFKQNTLLFFGKNSLVNEKVYYNVVKGYQNK